HRVEEDGETPCRSHRSLDVAGRSYAFQPQQFSLGEPASPAPDDPSHRTPEPSAGRRYGHRRVARPFSPLRLALRQTRDRARLFRTSPAAEPDRTLAAPRIDACARRRTGTALLASD